MTRRIRPIEMRDLYNLFFGKKLVESVKCGTAVQRRIIVTNQILNSDPVTQLTPISKIIYSAASPRSRPALLSELTRDNLVIDKLELKAEYADTDYTEKMENNGLGFYMEDYVAHYCHCPVCGEKTLRKYADSRIPVVDLICTNHQYHKEHHACCIFQVKISVATNYFSLKNRSISVGSAAYGKLAHGVQTSSEISKKMVVPGYICISLNRDSQIVQSYKIDTRNSFVLIPDYEYDEDAETYYSYGPTNYFGKDTITWNRDAVETMTLRSIMSESQLQQSIELECFVAHDEINPYKEYVKR